MEFTQETKPNIKNISPIKKIEIVVSRFVRFSTLIAMEAVFMCFGFSDLHVVGRIRATWRGHPRLKSGVTKSASPDGDHVSCFGPPPRSLLQSPSGDVDLLALDFNPGL